MSKGTILTDASSYNKALAEAENYHKGHLQDNLKRIKEKNQKIEEFASGKYDEITSNVDKVFQTIDQSISKTNNFIKKSLGEAYNALSSAKNVALAGAEALGLSTGEKSLAMSFIIRIFTNLLMLAQTLCQICLQPICLIHHGLKIVK